MHGAGTAQPGAATEFRPGHLHDVTQCPEQRHIRIGIDRADAAINSQSNHRRCSQWMAHLRRVYTPRMPVITAERYSGLSTNILSRRDRLSTNRRIFNLLPVTCRVSCFLQSIQHRFCGDRHVPHAHANRVIDRVGDRRRHHRRGRLANAARVIAGLDQLHVDLRNVSETNRRVVVEVALFDRTVLQGQPFRRSPDSRPITPRPELVPPRRPGSPPVLDPSRW